MCLLVRRTLAPGPGSPDTFPSPRKQELPVMAGRGGAREGFLWQWVGYGSWLGLEPSRVDTAGGGGAQTRMPQPLPD